VGPEALAQREIAAVVRFENTLADAVDLYTQTAGREEYYTTLSGGEPRELSTVVGRVWIFRANADGGELGRAEITSAEQTVPIPPRVDRARVKPRPASSPATTPAPDEPGPREEPAQPRVTLSDADLQAGLNEAKRAAKACGRTAVTPEVTVDLTIGGDGKVRAVVVRPPASGTPVAGCIKTELGKLSFPRSRDGGSATWTLPLY
jgi:hypothetical protein